MSRLPCLLLTLSLVASAACAQQGPVIVLTDTAEYCDQLQHRIQERAPWPSEVKRLYTEGRQMCDHGDIRVGINRLRQALRILNHHVPAQ